MSLQPHSTWRYIAIITIVLSMDSIAAFGTDLPPRMPVKAPPLVSPLLYDWSGPYIGGHLGYLWGRTRVEEDGAIVEDNARTASSAEYLPGTIGSMERLFSASRVTSAGATPMASVPCRRFP